MTLIRNGAKIRIDVWNQILDQNLLKCAEVESTEAAPAGTGGVCCAGASDIGSGVRSPGTADIAAVFHHNNEGLRFALGDQVVHDSSGVALAAPAGFIFTRAV